jgi:hypothetical protein
MIIADGMTAINMIAGRMIMVGVIAGYAISGALCPRLVSSPAALAYHQG